MTTEPREERKGREWTASVNGTGLRVEEVGSGAQTVVFSPNPFTNRGLFDAPVAALSRDYRCVRYDHRGQGDSGLGAPQPSTGPTEHRRTLRRRSGAIGRPGRRQVPLGRVVDRWIRRRPYGGSPSRASPLSGPARVQHPTHLPGGSAAGQHDDRNGACEPTVGTDRQRGAAGHGREDHAEHVRGDVHVRPGPCRRPEAVAAAVLGASGARDSTDDSCGVRPSGHPAGAARPGPGAHPDHRRRGRRRARRTTASARRSETSRMHAS